MTTKIVEACCVDETHVYYQCPNLNCRAGFHHHGSLGDFWTNRVENRSSHCEFDNCLVDVVITPETLRGNFRRLSRRGFKVVNKRRYNIPETQFQLEL